MSWIKQRGQNTPSPAAAAPQVQMYNPNQHNSQDNTWQQPQQSPQPPNQASNNWYGQPPQQFYPNQPYNQQYQEQTNFYQNQNTGYDQQAYGNVQYTQQYTPQFTAQPPQPPQQQPPAEGDGWASNWGWGDEDNSNVQAPQQPPTANIAASFATDKVWDWATDEGNQAAAKLEGPPEGLTGKRGKLETPQWSIESQLSQESSDDVLQTSESDKILSRSSTISHSPISGQEAPAPQPLGDHNTENSEIVALGAAPPPLDNPFQRTTNKYRAPQSVNLETPPDNSEHPDSIPPPERKLSKPLTRPENNEAPTINDRNQYLETGQLSETEAPTQDTLPPPGLRRMVLGQLEQNDTNRRIIPGGQPDPTNQTQTQPEPPEGLHRMIPGESSSPEAPQRHHQDIESEPELNDIAAGAAQPRSATIGADTPPVPSQAGTNRSETIGADTSPDLTITKRRDKDNDIGELTNSVRNLKVAEAATEETPRRTSSESDHEARGKSPQRRRERGRYTPEDYHDKKHDRRRYKDRRYPEEEPDYSDKERERRHRDEYERKYNSLRREKDKDRRPPRDERREREYSRNYYGRYEDDYENEPKSRTSSRTDSMHESYRERGHERERRDRRHHKEKDRSRRHRDPYNPYAPQPQPGYGYDAYSQYYQQYHYYENLRKTNPQAYAQLYRKYYQTAGGEAPSYGGEDRASVHSGRSSANDELGKDSFARPFDQTDNSVNYEDPTLSAQRLTPAKFATAHVKASIASGKLVKVLPHYPLDGQAPTVELCSLEVLLQSDEEYQELKRFPGPLIKGTTHKKTIIEYCEAKIRDAGSNSEIGDPESYVLMWELLILLIRQNGMVVGADIAELLLKNRSVANQRPPSVISSVSSNNGAESANRDQGHTSPIKEEEVTNKFREYLLYGSGKEALEWAMEHGLWGHALFLASKLDKRTYANVLMRFANGLTMNDPLQTLYQLLSGRTPAAVTCVADEKWGDWRPHLAMILSNSTQRPELNCKAITTLGDTLMGRGALYAAQFCYLMAEVGFSSHEDANAKLVLLGANHNKPFAAFTTNEAIHMTEIYEFACTLNDDGFRLVNFQRYKYLMATRLADMGLLERALSYLEKIAVFVVNNPATIEASLIDSVATLADRLKFYDPIGDGPEEDDGFGAHLDTSRPDNSWLKDLRQVQSDYSVGAALQNHNVSSTIQEEPVSGYSKEQEWQQPQYEQYQQQWSEPQVEVAQQQVEPQQDGGAPYQEQQYWAGQQQWDQANAYQQNLDPQPQSYYGSVASTEEISQPQISLPNQEKVQEAGPKREEPSKAVGGAAPTTDKTGNGWFGGIFSKLTLKPKNQMKLPDDKNPSIVWDPDKKKWTNTDGDVDDTANEFKPPPRMGGAMGGAPSIPATPLMPPIQAAMALPTNQIAPMVQATNQMAPEMNGAKPPLPNMFKLQRGRNLKKSYIDVFNPNGKGAGQGPGAPGPLVQSAPVNFFVPQPMNDHNAPTSFLTPAPQYDENSQGQ